MRIYIVLIGLAMLFAWNACEQEDTGNCAELGDRIHECFDDNEDADDWHEGCHDDLDNGTEWEQDLLDCFFPCLDEGSCGGFNDCIHECVDEAGDPPA